jgi:hypothetical protein
MTDLAKQLKTGKESGIWNQGSEIRDQGSGIRDLLPEHQDRRTAGPQDKTMVLKPLVPGN